MVHNQEGFCNFRLVCELSLLGDNELTDRLSFGCFLALLVLAGLEFRRDRRRSHREPGFIPPTSPNMTYGPGAGIGPASYAQVQPDTDRDHDGEHEDKFEQDNLQAVYDRPQAQRPQRQSYYPVQPAPTGGPAMSRPSMDAYGAFDGDMPGNQAQAGAGQTSRTMEMAYTDPCEYSIIAGHSMWRAAIEKQC